MLVTLTLWSGSSIKLNFYMKLCFEHSSFYSASLTLENLPGHGNLLLITGLVGGFKRLLLA